jgi:hypothetical protein
MIVWYENFKFFWRYCKNPADKLSVFLLLSPIINNWIDRTHIRSGNRTNYATAFGVWRAINRLADFNLILPPLGGLQDMCKLYRRLRGIYLLLVII